MTSLHVLADFAFGSQSQLKDVLKLMLPGSFLSATHLRSLRSASDYSEDLDEVTHQKLAPDMSATEKSTRSTTESSHKLTENALEVSDITVVREIQF